MSFPKLHGIQLAKNSWIENLHIERLGTDPASQDLTAAGRVWFNTTDKVVKFTTLVGSDIVVRSIQDLESAQTALNSLQSTLQGQISTVQSNLDTTNGNLAAEVSARQADIAAVQAALAAAISQEVTDRNAAIAVAASNASDALATETTARLAGDSAASTRMDDIQAELNATQAGSGLDVNGGYIPLVNSNYLDTATSLAQAQTLLDSALKTEAVTRAGADAALQSALNNEAQLRADGDAALQSQIQAYIDSAITNNVNADNAETAARIAADAAIQAELDQTQASIGLATDGTLIPISGTSYMDNSTTVFGAAVKLDLNIKRIDDALVAETAARQAVDAQLTSDLSAETAARTSADTALQQEINTVEAGAGLESDGTYAAPTGTNYLNAATSLKDADLKLDSAIKSEADRATAVEAGLQSQINSLVLSSGDGAAALKTQLNGGRYNVQTSTPATSHTISHGLASDFVQYTILVEGSDGKWRNDIVPVEIIDNNSFRVDLTESRNLRVTVTNNASLS